jgi:hypothetical protein
MTKSEHIPWAGGGDYSRDRVGGLGGDTSLPVGAGNLAVNMRQLAQSSLTYSSSNPQMIVTD